MELNKTYLSLCAEYYDLQPHRDEIEAMPFYMEYAQAAQGTVLEPMCGTGRFLLPMLAAGVAIEGFDASTAMLELLRKKNPEAQVFECFAENFVPQKQYSLVFIPYGSWGLIVDRAAQESALRALYNSLKAGGTFLFEVETGASAPTSLHTWHRSVRKRLDGTHIALNTFPTYDASTRIFTALCRYESLEQGIVVASEEEVFKMYLYAFDEMDQRLADIGFKTIKKYQDFKRTPADDIDAPLIIYECIK